MTRMELEYAVSRARELADRKRAAIQGASLDSVIDASKAFNDAFDRVKLGSGWSLSRCFDVILNGADF